MGLLDKIKNAVNPEISEEVELAEEAMFETSEGELFLDVLESELFDDDEEDVDAGVDPDLDEDKDISSEEFESELLEEEMDKIEDSLTEDELNEIDEDIEEDEEFDD